VIEAIGRLMEHDTAGDPVSGVKWTRRTTEKIAAELGTAGIVVCPNTVAKLLKGLGYRLRANAKKLNRQKDPGRDAQFVYIAAMRESFAQAGLPVVSVDSKHRELVGDFKNPGATWEEEPILVNDHDFPSQAKGVALPYGVYDVAANHACVSVGTTHTCLTLSSCTRFATGRMLPLFGSTMTSSESSASTASTSSAIDGFID